MPGPKDEYVIGTKWIFKDKIGEFKTIVRNKARLVIQKNAPKEGVDFDETFAPVAYLESISLLLAFTCPFGFKFIWM